MKVLNEHELTATVRFFQDTKHDANMISQIMTKMWTPDIWILELI